jgi:hypothetical protein
LTARTWRLLVAGSFALGLAIRIASVLGRPHLAPAGDPYQYWGQANLLAEGKGYIEPIQYTVHHTRVPTAKLPPLYTLLLTLCSIVGFKSFFAHRVWSAILNSVVVLTGAALGRRVAGPRVGVLTAVGVAIYPNIWMSAGIGMSETISPIMVTLVLLAAYRMRESPSWQSAAWLGLSAGLAALARDELLVLGALLLAIVAYGRPSDARPWPVRLRLAGAGAAAAATVLTPWVTFNMTRFSHPVFISDRLGVTLSSANCDTSWHGPLAGYWAMPCALASVNGVRGDESAENSVATGVGLRYVEHHLGSWPVVEAERLGRTFGFWRVSQQIGLDGLVEGRPRPWVWVGLWSFYGLVAAAPFGVIRLRRSGTWTFPLWAVLGDVVLVVLVTYGETRFRATLEPVLVLLAAVAIDGAMGGKLLGGRLSVGGRGPASSPEPSGPMSAETPGGPPLFASDA